MSIITVNKTTILDLFNNTQGKILNPRIKIPFEDGHILITVAQKAALPNFPNALYVKYVSKDKQVNAYIGAIKKTGEFFVAGTAISDSFLSKVSRHVREINTDPSRGLAVIGKEYSYCCFCGTMITSQASLDVGYGPICADNWGLPWGE